MAGFSKGIVAKEASESGDPNWSREDVRYSTIDYLPSTTENAVGPHVHDPRSGEILEADVQYYHNVMNLAKNWYFVQAGPNDPRAQQLPLPDDLMCNLVKYVVAHEVGPHARLPAQHEGQLDLHDRADSRSEVGEGERPHADADGLLALQLRRAAGRRDRRRSISSRRSGPYDKWATMWGYKPIPGAKTPEEEKPTLDKWAREQDAKPYLRFSTEGGGGDRSGRRTPKPSATATPSRRRRSASRTSRACPRC